MKNKNNDFPFWEINTSTAPLEGTSLIGQTVYVNGILGYICPNCLREIPNAEFRRGIGCPWCIIKENNND